MGDHDKPTKHEPPDEVWVEFNDMAVQSEEGVRVRRSHAYGFAPLRDNGRVHRYVPAAKVKDAEADASYLREERDRWARVSCEQAEMVKAAEAERDGWLKAARRELLMAETERDALKVEADKLGKAMHDSARIVHEVVTDSDALKAENERLRAENERLREALLDSTEALESVWAAIGDALCSGKGIVKAYSQSVATKASAAAEKARGIVGWKRAALAVADDIEAGDG